MVAYVSQQFASALKESHTVVSAATAYLGSQVQPLNVLSGSVKQRYDDSSRWSLDLEFLVPDDYTPVQLQNLFQQHQSIIVPYRGIQFPDGTQELIKQAAMFPTDVKLAESSGVPTLKVAAYDQSVRCQGNLAAPVYVAANGNLNTAVATLLRKKQPTMRFNLAASPYLTATTIITEDMDPWNEATRMMQSAGNDLFMNRADICVSSHRGLLPTPDYVWHFDENTNADFWDIDRTAQNDIFPNVVYVVSTNSATPGVTGEAADTNTNSPTYRYGPNGEEVRTFRSELITTVAQANEMAKYLLAKLLGPQDQVTFSCIPNPALDVGDTVAVTRASMGLNLTKMIVVEIDLPLQASDAMVVTCRRSILTTTTGEPVRP